MLPQDFPGVSMECFHLELIWDTSVVLFIEINKGSNVVLNIVSFIKIDTKKSGAVGYMFHFESVNHVFGMLKFSPFPIILLRIFWLYIVKISKF